MRARPSSLGAQEPPRPGVGVYARHRPPLDPRGLTPRMLSREQAAAYCGLTPRGFDGWIKAGIVPGPLQGTHRFDRHALDAAIDKRSGLTTQAGEAEDAFAAWERSVESHA